MNVGYLENESVSEAKAFDELLSKRWSCRAFLPEPVTTDTIYEILQSAQKTASWNNVQPWLVTIVRGDALKEFQKALIAHVQENAEIDSDFDFPREYAGVYLERRRACGFQLYGAVGVARGDKAGYIRQTMRNYEFFDAPQIALITSEEALGPYGAVDCGAYVSNFMLAASARGIASIAQGGMAKYARWIRNYFEIPEARQLVCGISFGYADMSHPANQFRVERAKLREVVTFIES